MEKAVYEIKTTSDVQMSVQKAECSTTGEKGAETKLPDEICFLIEGYSPHSDIDLQEHVTISKDEAKRLIKILEILS